MGDKLTDVQFRHSWINCTEYKYFKCTILSEIFVTETAGRLDRHIRKIKLI